MKKLLIVVLLLLSLISCKKTDVPDKQFYLGLRTNSSEKQFSTLYKLKQQLGSPTGIYACRLDWSRSFPLKFCNNLIQTGSMPLIFWEPWIKDDPEGLPITAIASGDYDDYIKEWIIKAKQFEYPLMIALAPNMNKQGFNWSATQSDRMVDTYILLMQHVIDLFRKEGALNVIWVWSLSQPINKEINWSLINRLYPGDDYIDWIGIEGFNLGTSQSWSNWKSPETLFSKSVEEISSLFPTKPIIVSGTATTSLGGDDKDWYRSLLVALQSSLKKVQAVILDDRYSLTKSSIKPLLESHLLKKDLERITSETQLVDEWGYIHKNNLSSVDWSKIKGLNVNKLSFIKKGADNWDGPLDTSFNVKMCKQNKELKIKIDLVDDIPFQNEHDRETTLLGDSIELIVLSQKKSESKKAHFLITLGNNQDITPEVWDVKRSKLMKDTIKMVVTDKIEILLTIPDSYLSNVQKSKTMISFNDSLIMRYFDKDILNKGITILNSQFKYKETVNGN
ncbi:hypothetical protein DID75_03670 [Candidatus Marinamargulisbacteria bacterium SCGC AG-410-N11]|nr:hypothetical protein DID75_03670 [Candidatus Marinamargulisbacteria bacterium SCGC AG-410-N11]